MTALTQDKGSLLRVKFGCIQTYTVGTGATIYYGALVAIKQGDGLLYPAAHDADDSEKFVIVGYAMEAGTEGEEIRIRSDGKIRLTWTGSTPYAGMLAIALDDQTVQPYQSEVTNIVVGRISEVISSQEVYVDLQDRPARTASSAND